MHRNPQNPAQAIDALRNEAPINRRDIGENRIGQAMPRSQINAISTLIGFNLDHGPVVVVNRQTPLRQLAQLQEHLRVARQSVIQYDRLHQQVPINPNEQPPSYEEVMQQNNVAPYLPIQTASRLMHLTGMVLSQSVPATDARLPRFLERIRDSLKEIRRALFPVRNQHQAIDRNMAFAATHHSVLESSINAGLTIEEASHILHIQARRLGMSISPEEAIAQVVQGAEYLNHAASQARQNINSRALTLINRVQRLAEMGRMRINEEWQSFQALREQMPSLRQWSNQVREQLRPLLDTLRRETHRINAHLTVNRLNHINRIKNNQDESEIIEHLNQFNADFRPQPAPSAPPLEAFEDSKAQENSPRTTPANTTPRPLSPNQEKLSRLFPELKWPKFTRKKREATQHKMRGGFRKKATPLNLPRKHPKLAPESNACENPYPQLRELDYHLNILVDFLEHDTAELPTFTTQHQALLQNQLMDLGNSIEGLFLRVEHIITRINNITGLVEVIDSSIQNILQELRPKTPTNLEKTESNTAWENDLNDFDHFLSNKAAEIDSIQTITDKKLMSDLLKANVKPKLAINNQSLNDAIKEIEENAQEIENLWTEIFLLLDQIDDNKRLEKLAQLAQYSPNKTQSEHFDLIMDNLNTIQSEIESLETDKLPQLDTVPKRYQKSQDILKRNLEQFLNKKNKTDIKQLKKELGELIA